MWIAVASACLERFVGREADAVTRIEFVPEVPRPDGIGDAVEIHKSTVVRQIVWTEWRAGAEQMPTPSCSLLDARSR